MTACVTEGPAGCWYADMAPGYTLRPLTEADLPAMLALREWIPPFYPPGPPTPTAEGLAADLTALPPGKSPADKHFLGFWREDRLAAVLDLIDGYPAADTAWIGLFMTARETQGKGEGTALIEYLLRRLEERGFARVGLAYAKGNPQSRAFWQKNGFTPTGREKDSGGYTAVVMERLMGKDNK